MPFCREKGAACRLTAAGDQRLECWMRWFSCLARAGVIGFMAQPDQGSTHPRQGLLTSHRSTRQPICETIRIFPPGGLPGSPLPSLTTQARRRTAGPQAGEASHKEGMERGMKPRGRGSGCRRGARAPRQLPAGTDRIAGRCQPRAEGQARHARPPHPPAPGRRAAVASGTPPPRTCPHHYFLPQHPLGRFFQENSIYHLHSTRFMVD